MCIPAAVAAADREPAIVIIMFEVTHSQLASASALVILKKGASKRARSSVKKWPPLTFDYTLSVRPNVRSLRRKFYCPVPVAVRVIKRIVIPPLFGNRAPCFTSV